MDIKKICLEIKMYLKEHGISIADAAKMMGEPESFAYNSLSGQSGFGAERAKKWAEAFGFNEVYLRTGEGQLISDNQPKKEKKDMEKAIEAIQSSNQITLKAQEQTDRLLSLLELQMGAKPWTVGEKEKGLRDGQK